MRQRSAEIQGTIIREELAAQRERLAKEEDVFFMDIPLLIEMGIRTGLTRFGWWQCHRRSSANA